MFVSPCCLRSTQCAALIALATAAGIMRVELAEARPSASRSTNPEGNLTSRLELPRSLPVTRFEIAFEAVAPWLAVFQVAAQFVGERPAEMATPLPVTAPATPLPFPTRLHSGPAARPHSYPFAVGPPAHGTTSFARADDTSLSPDSTARSFAVSRVVVVSLLSFSARLTRLGTPGPKLAGTFSSPSFALRGEPVALRLPSAASAAFGLPSRRPAAPLAPTSLSVS